MNWNHTFKVVEMGGSFAAVPFGKSAAAYRNVITLNQVGAQIFRYAQQSDTVDEVCERMSRDYPRDDPERIRGKVTAFMSQMEQAGVLTL